MYNFNYHRPTSVAEAAALLSANEDARLLAGGHTYIPTLKQRLAQPSDIIDLTAIAELRGIKEEAGGLTIGAMTRHFDVVRSEAAKRIIPGLVQLVSMVGDAQVKHRGTIGGSIANNDPAADYPGAVVGLNATVRTNRREIKADDFFTGLFDTALERDEILTAVHFPKPERSGYAKFRNPASRYAMVGSFVAKTRDGVRIAITGAGPTVFRWAEAENAMGSDLNAAAIENLSVDPSGLNSDIHASAEYRAHLIKVMTKRAIEAAI